MDSQTNNTTGVGLLGRLLWMLLGPLGLVLATFNIAHNGNGWTTTADFAFFIILGFMVLGRWLEFQGGTPLKATGEPATHGDLVRYSLGAGVVGIGIWVVANMLGNFWL